MMRYGLVAAFGLAALLPSLAAADSAADPGPVVSVPGDRIADAITPTTSVTVEVVETPYDGLQALLDAEARQAMADGKYRRAWHLFWRLLELDPNDTRALREAGRVAQALGAFNYSVEAFAKVSLLSGGKADPELHFLRGEALHALGRVDEANAEWKACAEELAVAPLDYRGTLWLARIAALRGELDASIALYQTVLPVDRQSAGYAEVSLAKVEAYTMSKKWKDAERELRAFMVAQPAHLRAKELMAWVLEARGTHGAAVRLRADFADEWTDHPRKTVEYARALERVHRLPAALERYREAHDLGVADLEKDIARVDGRVSPELGAGGALREDAGGLVYGWNAGANLGIGGRRRLVVTALQEQSAEGGTLGDDTVLTGSIWGVQGTASGGRVGLGVTALQQEKYGSGVGASALLATSPDRPFQVQLRGDYNQAWRESATTVREGGTYDGVTAAAYASALDSRLLFSVGLQGRRLSIAPRAGEDRAHSMQMLGVAGADYVLTRDVGSQARGEILGEDMLAPRSLSSSIVLSYRHYEFSGEDPFGPRLTLVERSSLDEVAVSASQVLDPRGMVAVELRGGLGRDWVRDGQRYRVGGALMLSVTRSSRLTLDYDLATETNTGLVGRRQAGTAVFHVDL